MNYTRLSQDRSGFTLIEIMIVGVMAAGVLFVLIKLQPQILQFTRHASEQQSLAASSRQCVDLISSHLANARAGTIAISTPGAGAPPNSRINFIASDETAYAITWSTAPPNSVHLLRTPAGSGTTFDSILAANVTALMFFVSDIRDPSVIRFTVRQQIPLDAGDPRPDRTASILVANQIVQAVTRQ